MLKVHPKLLALSVAAVFAVPAAIAPTAGQAAGGRQSMEQCVNRVLSRLSRFAEAGPRM